MTLLISRKGKPDRVVEDIITFDLVGLNDENEKPELEISYIRGEKVCSESFNYDEVESLNVFNEEFVEISTDGEYEDVEGDWDGADIEYVEDPDAAKLAETLEKIAEKE